MKTNRFDGPNQDYALINTTFSRFLANLCWITATFQALVSAAGIKSFKKRKDAGFPV